MEFNVKMSKAKAFDDHSLKYDTWFEKYSFAYQSELHAIKSVLPHKFFEGIEIGVGTGRFAAPLGIKYGIEPSAKMREIAKQRGVEVVEGFAETLPFDYFKFDLVLMVTTICFLDDILKSLKEAYRVLKSGGCIIIGYIEKNSFLGKQYQRQKNKSVFYQSATFYSSNEVASYLAKAGFTKYTFVQTIFHSLKKINKIEPIKEGYGDGSFVVVRAIKELLARKKKNKNV